MDNDTSTTQAEIRVARNSVYGIVRLVMTTPLLFVLVPYMLRNLGPERYGVWALVGTLWALVHLGDLGLSTTVTKFVAALSSNDDTERINKVVTIAFITNALIGTTVFIALLGLRRIIVIYGFAIPIELVHEAEFIVVAAGLVFGLRLVFGTFLALLDGLQRMGVTNSLIVLSIVLEAVGTYAVLELNYGLRGLILKNGITAMGVGICSLVVAKKCLPSLGLAFRSVHKEDLRNMFGYSLRIQTVHILSFAVDPFNKVLLSNVLSVAYVSYYEVASRIAQQFRSFFLAGMAPILPAASKLHASGGNSAGALELYYRFTRYVILLALPFSIIAMAFARPFVRLWLGEGYNLVGLTLQIILGAWGLSILATPAAQVLLALGLPHLAVRIQVITGLANVLCSFTLIHGVGYIGVPFGTLIALAAGAGYTLYALHRATAEPIRNATRFLTPSVIVANLGAAVLALIVVRMVEPSGWLSLLLAAASCFLLYFLIALRLGCITDEDWEFTRRLLSESPVH